MALLKGRKNLNFFKKAVDWSDFMKRNYEGFTFKLNHTGKTTWLAQNMKKNSNANITKPQPT